MVEICKAKCLFPPCQVKALEELAILVSKEDIRMVVFTIRSLKAPMSNYIHVIFFQSQWEIVREFVCKFIEDIFENLDLVEWVNQTLLMLVPKLERPINLKQFIPLVYVRLCIRLLLKCMLIN